jgi:hypothetical protein
MTVFVIAVGVVMLVVANATAEVGTDLMLLLFFGIANALSSGGATCNVESSAFRANSILECNGLVCDCAVSAVSICLLILHMLLLMCCDFDGGNAWMDICRGLERD